jgi:hypothetical protein
MNFGFDNGATGGSTLGTPSWLLTSAAVVNSGSPGAGTGSNPLGSFTLHNVAAGIYNIFLYGQNYDATRGAAFAITTGGGTAVGGISSTLNTGNRSSFVLGDNYVEFTGVVPVGGSSAELGARYSIPLAACPAKATSTVCSWWQFPSRVRWLLWGWVLPTCSPCAVANNNQISFQANGLPTRKVVFFASGRLPIRSRRL